MVLGFVSEQVAPIVAGTKAHCLREGLRCQVGMQLQFYAYLRQVGMYPFRAPALVVGLQVVELTDAGNVLLDSQALDAPALHALAQAEGFATTSALLVFLAGRPQLFRGQLIHWA